MKFELFPFQQKARDNLRKFAAIAQVSYPITNVPQVISFTAPTGAGKTIMMAAFVESVFRGDENYPAQTDSIFVWLSDSPELNKQSLDKFYFNSDGVNHSQLIIIEDETFNQKFLDDGKIYFLNTQKLGKSSNLTRHSDSRQYTIWETLQNTIIEKTDKLYFIIDEAHRGMKQGRATATATTIMQKFIKGSADDGISPAPLVIGMSATPERFNALVAGTSSTIHQVVVTTEEVRLSGLLKERIIVVHPDEKEKSYVSKDMAMLEAAADEWKSKCEHWQQYCREQHKKLFNPIFVVQVMNGTGKKISETDLDECLKRISVRTGFDFKVGEVVHTFGDTAGDLTINNLRVVYEEPSHISGNDAVKIVFFKENLSTGWDCPQAETMMSFRRATDATYIAQLLGRMIRTPMQSHIEVDDTLNDVRLYLPYFDKVTVQNVVDELQKAEGGVISADVISESVDNRTLETWTVKTENHINVSVPPVKDFPKTTNNIDIIPPVKSSPQVEPLTDFEEDFTLSENEIVPKTDKSIPKDFTVEKSHVKSSFAREEVVKAINQMGLLTYKLRSVKINDYLKSLLKLAHFLTRHFIYEAAFDDIKTEIINMIHNYIEGLKKSNEYDELKQQAKQFRLSAQIFDAFGKSVESVVGKNLFVTTDTDIERQFLQAEAKLKSFGIANAYINAFCNDYDYIDDYKIDVILFAANSECFNRLEKFSQKRFHNLNDEYRRKIAKYSSSINREYERIVDDSDILTEHNFTLPETITVKPDKNGKEYRDHLFVAKNTGTACIKLNGWEEGILQEEQQRKDFVCWIRNPQNRNIAWTMCIPYQKENNETHIMCPDLLIVRRVEDEYIVDILEPHDPERRDNVGKARGFAEYARKNNGIGRLQLIREMNKAGLKYFSRLDMSKGEICEKVRHISSNNELDCIFEEYGRSE